MISKSELDYIRGRWQADRKISAASVDKLLDAADRALTMQAARDVSRPTDRLGRIIDDLTRRY